MTALTDTALLIMDVQVGVVANIAPAAEVPGRLAPAADAARAAGIQLIYVVGRFAPGHPEIGERSAEVFRNLKASGAFTDDDPNTAVHPALTVAPGDLVVPKKRYGGFSGSSLGTALRANGITSLVLSGVVTSGAVLSTVTAAFDLDYAVTVLEDGCADYDPEVHRVLTEKVFPRRATVRSIADWTASL